MKKREIEKSTGDKESQAFRPLKELITSSGILFDARQMKAMLAQYHHDRLLAFHEYQTLITILQNSQYNKLRQLIQNHKVLGMQFWHTAISSEHIKKTITTQQYRNLLRLLGEIF